MYTTECQDCFQNFSRRDKRLIHRRNKHIGDKTSEAYPRSSEAYPPPQGVLLPPLPPPQQQGVIQPPPPPPQEYKPPRHKGVLPPQQEENIDTVLQHPFTMIISRPTGRFQYSYNFKWLGF